MGRGNVFACHAGDVAVGLGRTRDGDGEGEGDGRGVGTEGGRDGVGVGVRVGIGDGVGGRADALGVTAVEVDRLASGVGRLSGIRGDVQAVSTASADAPAASHLTWLAADAFRPIMMR